MGTEAEDAKELIIMRLHERCGICGHCGKKKCAAKSSNSRLPAKMSVEDVLWAINLDGSAV